jgi:ammonia channel protein AmtB
VALAGEHPAAATLVVLAAALPPLLARRDGTAWSLPAAAPALGLAGLAGAYPALAGRARRARTRAALGAIGAAWALLAEPLLDRALVLGTPAPPRRWDATPGRALADAAWPLVTSGAALLTVAWALAALVLPWIVRGRHLSFDVVAATAWAAGLGASTAALAERVPGAAPAPVAVAAGAVAAGLVAILLPRVLPRARDTVIGSEPTPSG